MACNPSEKDSPVYCIFTLGEVKPQPHVGPRTMRRPRSRRRRSQSSSATTAASSQAVRPAAASEGDRSQSAASAGVRRKKSAARVTAATAARGNNPTKRMPASGSAMAAMRWLSASEASATSCVRGEPRNTVP